MFNPPAGWDFFDLLEIIVCTCDVISSHIPGVMRCEGVLRVLFNGYGHGPGEFGAVAGTREDT